MAAKLIQLTGTRATYALEKGVTTIGRSPDNDVVVRDERVSKAHAQIVRQKNEYYLEDLDSRNGTFFEGKSILKVHLQPDDEFQIGPIAFQFVVTREAARESEQPERGFVEDSALKESHRSNVPPWVLFYYPVIRLLNNGEIISAVVAFVFQLVGVLSFAGGLYSIVDILKMSFQQSTEVTVGGIVMSIVMLAGLLAVVQIFFYRAKNIKDLGASDYTVIPIFGYLFRAVGESVATMGVASGIGGCLYIWFARDLSLAMGYSVFNFLSPERAFVSGLLCLLVMFAFSFLILIVAYLLAESIVVSVDIAKNVQAMRSRAESTEEH